MRDIENFAYKPNINNSVNDALDLISRTQFIKMSTDEESEQFQISSNGRLDARQAEKIFQVDEHTILVIDSEDTVLVMLHYVEQTSTKQNLLIKNCLEFFEKTVLPTAEWMTTLMTTKFDPANMKKGQKIYDEFKSILPPLFENEIRAGSLI